MHSKVQVRIPESALSNCTEWDKAWPEQRPSSEWRRTPSCWQCQSSTLTWSRFEGRATKEMKASSFDTANKQTDDKMMNRNRAPATIRGCETSMNVASNRANSDRYRTAVNYAQKSRNDNEKSEITYFHHKVLFVAKRQLRIMPREIVHSWKVDVPV